MAGEERAEGLAEGVQHDKPGLVCQQYSQRPPPAPLAEAWSSLKNVGVRPWEAQMN